MKAVDRFLGGSLGFGLGFSLVVLWGCSPPAVPGGSGPRGDWLAESGFHARSSWPSTLLHLSREEIGSSRRVSALIQGVDGITVRPGSLQGLGIEELRPGGHETCQVHVYLNGRRLHRGPGRERIGLDEAFPTRVLDGLEYHAAPDGPIFEDDGCGSLLLWSAELRTRQDRDLHSRIEGRVLSSSPDTVTRVELQPAGRSQLPGANGTFSFRDLLPGEYELAFFSHDRLLTGLKARVFAFRGSRIDLEIGREPEGGACP